MTAQIGNHFKFQGKQYNIVQMSKELEVNFEQYGITPSPCCTACWNGYWCDYDIREEGIFLENLYVHSQDGNYPAIHGVEAYYEADKKKLHRYMGHHLYKGLHLKCDYTGGIVMGRKFLPEHYVHMGYQRAWAYEEVLELIFMKGTLAKVIDHSKAVAEMRSKIKVEKDSRDKEFIRIPVFQGVSFEWDHKDLSDLDYYLDYMLRQS